MLADAMMPQLDGGLLKLLLTVVGIVVVAILSNQFVRKFVLKRESHVPHLRPLPPGPGPWPVIGNLPCIGPLPHQSLSKLAKTYGPLMYLRLGSVPTVIISSAEMAEEVLKTHDKVFASRPHVTSCEIMGYNSQNFGFLPYGDQWRNARKLFNSALVTAKRVEDTQSFRKEEILLMLRAVVEESGKNKGETGVPMFSQFFQMATNIVMRLMISKPMFGSSADVALRSSEFRSTVTELFRLFGVFNLGDFIPSLKRFDLQGYEKKMRVVHRKLDVFLQGFLDARTEDLRLRKNDGGKEAGDFMDVLLTHPTETTGKPMTPDQIKGMLVDVLLAGTDTTAITLEWALSELLKNPEVLRKCQEELDSVVGRKRLVHETDLPALPYLLAVVKEIFRMHPAGALMLPHESIEDSEVGGYFIPAHSRVMINAWAIARDPAVWERALEFIPERFLPEHTDCNVDVHGRDFKLLPFGSGRRSCPGKILALRVVQFTLAVMLQSCNWALPANAGKPEQLDMSEKFALGVAKAVQLEAIATPRLPISLMNPVGRD